MFYIRKKEVIDAKSRVWCYYFYCRSINGEKTGLHSFNIWDFEFKNCSILPLPNTGKLPPARAGIFKYFASEEEEDEEDAGTK